MSRQCLLLASPPAAHVVKQQLQCFRSDGIRRDELMARVNLPTVVDEMDQRGCIDDVAGHWSLCAWPGSSSGARDCTWTLSPAFPRSGRFQFSSIVWSSE